MMRECPKRKMVAAKSRSVQPEGQAGPAVSSLTDPLVGESREAGPVYLRYGLAGHSF